MTNFFTNYFSTSFDVGFSFLSHDKSVLWIDLIHLLTALVLFYNVLNFDFTETNQNNVNLNEPVRQKTSNWHARKLKSLIFKAFSVLFTAVSTYSHLVSCFWSPNNPLTYGFIHHHTPQNRKTMANLACFYGIFLFVDKF